MKEKLQKCQFQNKVAMKMKKVILYIIAIDFFIIYYRDRRFFMVLLWRGEKMSVDLPYRDGS